MLINRELYFRIIWLFGVVLEIEMGQIFSWILLVLSVPLPYRPQHSRTISCGSVVFINSNNNQT